jgi:arginyl-tRNA synthetase
MTSIDTDIRERLTAAAKRAGLDVETAGSAEIVWSEDKTRGDLATNLALAMAGKTKSKPRDIAAALIQHFETDPLKFDKIEIAGPGFINFTLSLQFWREALAGILDQNENYGRHETGKGKSVQVEFVSANPTGPLTIGHGRQAVLGDVIARLYERIGYRVVREYYFNNAGRQMRVLGESVRLRYLEQAGQTVEFPEDHYQGEYIKDIASAVAAEKGIDPKIGEDLRLFQQAAETTIFKDIQKTLKRLGIVFDVYFNENSLYETGQIDAVLAELRSRDLAYDHEGAVWFRASRFGLEDRVIVKSTGEPTYRLPDIAYHVDKMRRGFDLVIDIFGADHIATYPDVMAGLKALGYDPSKIRVLIHQFVTLTEGKEKIKMSTRKANFVTLDELMDEVGEDVTRYFFINRTMSSHLNFDLTLAKTQSDENPVYYVQYAHARISSILRFAEREEFDMSKPADFSLLTDPREIDLIRSLVLFPQTVLTSALEFEPHRITACLEEIATVYHRFQHAGKVEEGMRVVTKNAPLTAARLALCRAARIVLANGLSILGVSRPEAM